MCAVFPTTDSSGRYLLTHLKGGKKKSLRSSSIFLESFAKRTVCCKNLHENRMHQLLPMHVYVCENCCFLPTLPEITHFIYSNASQLRFFVGFF